MIRPVRLACIALLAAASWAEAVVIQLDYTYDNADGGGFFATNSTARQSLEAAAADLSAAMGSSLEAVTTDQFTGSNAGTTATIDWALVATNPVTGGTQNLSTFTFPSDTIRIFVGLAPINDSLILGQAGPSTASFSISSSGIPSKFPTALDNAEALSNATMTRGGGPTVATFTGSASLGATSSNFTLAIGALAGTLALDGDTNNDGLLDNTATLNAFWHFDHNTPVAAGKFDFYSVALHELMHTLGFGISETWDAKSNGTTDWSGSNAISIAGSGSNLVTLEGHIREGLTSFRLSDGASQEVAMDPTLLQGTRKSLTQLDIAFLRDLGYTTVPEPSSAALLAFALALTSRRTTRRLASSGGRSCRRS